MHERDTRCWPGQRDSLLDLLFTNVPEKMSEVQTQVKGSSDHRYISATRYAKSIKSRARYVMKRSFKDFNEDQFVKDIQQINKVVGTLSMSRCRHSCRNIRSQN